MSSTYKQRWEKLKIYLKEKTNKSNYEAGVCTRAGKHDEANLANERWVTAYSTLSQMEILEME
jgi:hypothetical protein